MGYERRIVWSDGLIDYHYTKDIVDYVVNKYRNGMPVSEIARRERIAPSTVKRWIWSAKQRNVL